MAKNVAEWFILIWNSLLVLLITGWVLIEFYEWKDSIVAAIIAFTGAVIGGGITWLGVKVTIDNSNKIRKLDAIPSKIERINKFYNSLIPILEIMFVEDQGANRTFTSANDILKYIEENEMVSESMLISESVFNGFQDLIMYVKKESYCNLMKDDCFETYSDFQLNLKEKLEGLNILLESEAIIITKYYLENKI